MKMKYLSYYTQKAQTEALNKAGAFFAFGQKQFDDQKKEGVKYTALHGGLICPSKNVDQLLSDLDRALENGIRQDVQENGFNAIVRREYFNHETQISMDTTDVMGKLDPYKKMYPDQFTDQAIQEAFKRCWNIAVKEDLF